MIIALLVIFGFHIITVDSVGEHRPAAPSDDPERVSGPFGPAEAGRV